MRVVVVPGVPALRPEYASIEDPVAELRAAVRAARAWLEEDQDGLLLVANGSAKRTEKAPGHFDERAEGFDEELGAALASGDLDALRAIDVDLAAELLADVDALVGLGPLGEVTDVHVDYDDAPYGVQYWVVRYECAS
ncbi:MAG: hypothetical protein ACJ72O_17565 [Marmoricola sp.]